MGFGIKNYNIKYDFKNYISDSFKLNYGINGIYYEFNPGTIRPSNPTSGINFDQLDKMLSTFIYLSAEQNVSDKLSVTYGLRYSMFYRLGTSTVNYYADKSVTFNTDLQLYEKATPTSTQFFSKNKVIQTYKT
jgi:hypothetical protein